MTTAWDGGQCGPIQDQLRQLVADKIAAARNQIADGVLDRRDLKAGGGETVVPLVDVGSDEVTPGMVRGRVYACCESKIEHALVVGAHEGEPGVVDLDVETGCLVEADRFIHVRHRQSRCDVEAPCSLHQPASTGATGPAWVLLAVTALVIAGLASAAWRGTLGSPVAAGLILGGAVANLVDRAGGGSVTDMIDVGWWPTFNAADIAITTGVALLVLKPFNSSERRVTSHPTAEAKSDATAQ